jgi:hypothetical protein
MKDETTPMPQLAPVPPFAPRGHVQLIAMLDEIGRATDPTWTEETLDAKPSNERTDAQLEMEAFLTFQREIADNSEIARSEDEIRSELHEAYEVETAQRRRRQAVVQCCRDLLHRKVLTAIAFGSDGHISSVSQHVWAADGADELFDNGGTWLVHKGELTVCRGGRGEGQITAIALIRTPDLQSVVTHLKAGTLPAHLLAPRDESQADPPGPKPGMPTIKAMVWDVALNILTGPNKPPPGHGRLARLSRLVKSELRKQNHQYQESTITKYLGLSLKDWERENSDK